MDDFETAIKEFRKKTDNSPAAETTIRLLMESLQEIPPHWGGIETTRYSDGYRNDIIIRLASDVEKALGEQDDLLFRTRGQLHDSLQDLIDAYLDAIDAAKETN